MVHSRYSAAHIPLRDDRAVSLIDCIKKIPWRFSCLLKSGRMTFLGASSAQPVTHEHTVVSAVHAGGERACQSQVEWEGDEGNREEDERTFDRSPFPDDKHLSAAPSRRPSPPLLYDGAPVIPSPSMDEWWYSRGIVEEESFPGYIASLSQIKAGNMFRPLRNTQTETFPPLPVYVFVPDIIYIYILNCCATLLCLLSLIGTV